MISFCMRLHVPMLSPPRASTYLQPGLQWPRGGGSGDRVASGSALPALTSLLPLLNPFPEHSLVYTLLGLRHLSPWQPIGKDGQASSSDLGVLSLKASPFREKCVSPRQEKTSQVGVFCWLIWDVFFFCIHSLPARLSPSRGSWHMV